jgi:hypothetical protein
LAAQKPGGTKPGGTRHWEAIVPKLHALGALHAGLTTNTPDGLDRSRKRKV